MKHERAVQEAIALLTVQMRDWGQSMAATQIDLLSRYAEFLATYSEANVIGSKEVPAIVLDHVLDSLSCVSIGIEIEGKSIDVGSGGGLPGIPFAITHPRVQVTLLEATGKKVKFLQHVKDELQLPNLGILNARAEDAGMDRNLRDSNNLAVARALASLPVVLEYCAPFVKEGGVVLAMKGRLEEKELTAGRRAAARIGAELHSVVPVRFLPELEQKQRRIVVFRKTAPTPTGYPRRVGLAKKRPLGS